MKSYAFIEAFGSRGIPAAMPLHPLRLLRALGGQLATWHMRARTRRELAWLGEHDLKDLGISPQDAWIESAKPFWRP